MTETLLISTPSEPCRAVVDIYVSFLTFDNCTDGWVLVRQTQKKDKHKQKDIGLGAI